MGSRSHVENIGAEKNTRDNTHEDVAFGGLREVKPLTLYAYVPKMLANPLNAGLSVLDRHRHVRFTKLSLRNLVGSSALSLAVAGEDPAGNSACAQVLLDAGRCHASIPAYNVAKAVHPPNENLIFTNHESRGRKQYIPGEEKETRRVRNLLPIEESLTSQEQRRRW